MQMLLALTLLLTFTFNTRVPLFYKQLGSGPSSQSCLYFQDFQGLKLLNGCLVVRQNEQNLSVF